MDIGQVFGPIAGRLACRMQRKAQERQSMDAIERRRRLRLRRHAPAERFAAGYKKQSRAASSGFRDSGAHRGLRNRRRVGPLRAFFHIRELIAQRRDAAFAKAGSNCLHEWMGHPGACAMGKDKTRTRPGGADQKRGDGGRIRDLDLKLLRSYDFHLI
jgi:hypothetical protein